MTESVLAPPNFSETVRPICFHVLLLQEPTAVCTYFCNVWLCRLRIVFFFVIEIQLVLSFSFGEVS